MIDIRIKEIAKERGIKNAHRLQLAAELSPAVASRFWKREIEKISMETLGRLCKALECQPGDLLVFVADENSAPRKGKGVEPNPKPVERKQAAAGKAANPGKMRKAREQR